MHDRNIFAALLYQLEIDAAQMAVESFLRKKHASWNRGAHLNYRTKYAQNFGLHVHCSVIDKDGKNILDARGGDPVKLKSICAGMLQTMRDAQLRMVNALCRFADEAQLVDLHAGAAQSS